MPCSDVAAGHAKLHICIVSCARNCTTCLTSAALAEIQLCPSCPACKNGLPECNWLETQTAQRSLCPVLLMLSWWLNFLSMRSEASRSKKMRVHADLASSRDRSNAGAQGVPQQVQGSLLGTCNTPAVVEPQSQRPKQSEYWHSCCRWVTVLLTCINDDKTVWVLTCVMQWLRHHQAIWQYTWQNHMLPSQSRLDWL